MSPEEEAAARVYEKMREEDIKLTQQRRLIIKLLVKHQDSHPSADELHQLVRGEDPDVGLATVYRTLDLLERLNVAQAVSFGDGRTRYELASEPHQHHHLLCIQCGKIEEVDEDLLGAVEDAVMERTGFSVVDHELKLFGVCYACDERDSGSENHNMR